MENMFSLIDHLQLCNVEFMQIIVKVTKSNDIEGMKNDPSKHL